MRTLAIILVMLAGCRSMARWNYRDAQGGAQLHYDAVALHAVDHPDAMTFAAARDSVMGNARLHGFYGGKHLGLHAGLDLGAGGTIHGGGFAYDVSLFPIGLALRFFETSFLTVSPGVGASGATGVMDDAATFPLEARLEVGRGVRMLARARVSYVAAAPMREDGARMGDELEGMLGLRIGNAYDEYGFPTGNGYFVGASYKEQLGTRFLGLVIGYSIDAGTRRRPRTDRDYDGMCCVE